MSSRELQSNKENGCEEDITPLICLRDAAFFNDVETLKLLLDSPIWHKFRDNWGCNILHIAIRRQNDEVFDYLLSLGDFPIDEVDVFGCTALQIAIEQYSCKIGCKIYERYILQLIKCGADINVIRPGGDPILHYALRKFFPLRLVQSLIEGGADLNTRDEQGLTLLFTCLNCVRLKERSPKDMNEVIAMLVYYGVDTSITYNVDVDDDDDECSDIRDMTAFDYCLRYCCNMTVDDMNVVLENLFFLTVDELNPHTFFGDDLLFLTEYHDSLLFHQAIKYTSGIIFDKGGNDLMCNLFAIDLEYLQIILETSPHVVKEYLQNSCPSDVSTEYLDLNRFETLIHSSVSSDALEFISRLNKCGHMVLIPNIEDINELIEAIYYFLSYGAVLYQRDLDFIYERTGYTEDFKNLLFMDIHTSDGLDLCYSELFISAMIPRLIYDVTLDIHKIMENPRQCEFINWDRIFDYFVHPKIQNAYHQLKPNEATKKQLPRVPLLQELARDTFRKYFLQVFKITTPRQFYGLVKLIPNRSVQKIITYESKLY